MLEIGLTQATLQYAQWSTQGYSGYRLSYKSQGRGTDSEIPLISKTIRLSWEPDCPPVAAANPGCHPVLLHACPYPLAAARASESHRRALGKAAGCHNRLLSLRITVNSDRGPRSGLLRA